MVHRIDIGRRALPTIEFQGVLDPAAFFELRRHVRGLVASGARVRLVLKTGTEVDPACVDALRDLASVDLVAEAAYLARWLGGPSPPAGPKPPRPPTSNPSPPSPPMFSTIAPFDFALLGSLCAPAAASSPRGRGAQRQDSRPQPARAEFPAPAPVAPPRPRPRAA